MKIIFSSVLLLFFAQSAMAGSESQMNSIFSDSSSLMELSDKEMSDTTGAGRFSSQSNMSSIGINSWISASSTSNGGFSNAIALGVYTPVVAQNNISTAPVVAPVINLPNISMPAISVCGLCRR